MDTKGILREQVLYEILTERNAIIIEQDKRLANADVQIKNANSEIVRLAEEVSRMAKEIEAANVVDLPVNDAPPATTSHVQLKLPPVRKRAQAKRKSSKPKKEKTKR